MGYFCPKNTFLQLRACIQRIYVTLLSIACVKIHQIRYVIFETISHFSRHNSSAFLAQTLHIFDKNSPSEYKFSDFPLLALNFTKFLMLFFSQKVSSSSEFRSLFSVIRDNSSVLFQLKLYILLSKEAHQSVNSQTFNCSREISPN